MEEITDQQIKQIITLLFISKPPKKEVPIKFVRDSIAAYCNLAPEQLELNKVSKMLREMVGQGVVPRTMWRQSKNDQLPEIRWVFISTEVSNSTMLADTTRKFRSHKPGKEKPFSQSIAAKRLKKDSQS